MAGGWYTSPHFRKAALVAGLLFVAVHAVLGIFFRDTDFRWHLDLGRRFLAGEPFAHGEGDWYPLSRALFDTLPALLPYRLARGLFFLAAVGCVGVAVVLWNHMAEPSRQLNSATTFAAAVLSLAFLSPYFSRDFYECGLQLLLLGLLTGAGYALWRGRENWAGFWLGLAIAYKFTPILFLPLLLWKRRWRAALATLVVVVGVNLLPAAFLGWDATVRSHERWWQRFQMVSGIEDIAENGVEAPKVNNQGLMAALARYLQSYPEGHPLRLDHPAFVQFGNLDANTARGVAKAFLLLLAAGVAWRVRGRWTSQAPELPYQWACACALVALISPLCWRQHLVLTWPAMFLLVRSLLGRQGAVKRYWFVVAGIVLCVYLPQREIIGRPLSLVVLSYKLDTFAVLACALASLFEPARLAGEFREGCTNIEGTTPSKRAA